MEIIVVSYFVILIALMILMILTLLNKKLPIWACNKLGWHLTPLKIQNDGCSNGGICPRCNKKVLQDSQGNWF